MDVRISQPLGFSQSGGRPNNEDAFFPEPQQATPKQKWFLVCDGVGGAERGEVASQMAVTQFDAYFRQNPVAVATDAYIQQALTTVQDAFDAYLANNPQAEGMGTTLTLIYIHEAGATVAHLGDSRVYLVRKGEIVWRTDDHSYVNELVKAGVLKPADAQRHPQRNVITRAIQGGEKRAQAAVQLINDLQPGDYFFLCTDGVLERITDELLENTLGSLNTDDEKLRMLWGFCHGQTRDNFTGYLIPVASVSGEIDPAYRVPQPVYDRSYIDNDGDHSVTVISAPTRPAPVVVPTPTPQPLAEPAKQPFVEESVAEPVVAQEIRSTAGVPVGASGSVRETRPASSRILIGVALVFGLLALGIGGYVFWQRMQQTERQEARQKTANNNQTRISDQQAQVITQNAQKIRQSNSATATNTTTAVATTTATITSTSLNKAAVSQVVTAAQEATTKPTTTKPEKTTVTAKENIKKSAESIETALIIKPTTSANVFVGKKGDRYGLLKKDKKTWLVEPKYEEISNFMIGVADVKLNGKTKYLTLDGHQYDDVEARNKVACERLWVKKGNRYGYLNTVGLVAIDFRYDKAHAFSDDCTAEVKKGDRTFLIDKKGNEVKSDNQK
jgi:serine/threonine protein phosphatase PrpC/uncharacterized membrane protein